MDRSRARGERAERLRGVDGERRTHGIAGAADGHEVERPPSVQWQCGRATTAVSAVAQLNRLASDYDVDARLDGARHQMNHLMMETTVTELLREFPKIRRAALRGERVVIRTRGGTLVLQREAPETPLLGSLAGQAEDRGLSAKDRAFSPQEWGE